MIIVCVNVCTRNKSCLCFADMCCKTSFIVLLVSQSVNHTHTHMHQDNLIKEKSKSVEINNWTNSVMQCGIYHVPSTANHKMSIVLIIQHFIPALAKGWSIIYSTCVMQVSEDNKSAKWLTLESPKISYTALLIRIKDNLGEREMDTFQFAFRDELPRTVLEVRNFLQWFIELENRCLLSPDDLSRLENFLQLVSLRFLLTDIRCFQAKRIVVRFFQRSVEAKIPGRKLGKVSCQPS